MKIYERYVSFHHFFFLNNCIYLFLVALHHGLCLVAVNVGYSPWQCTGFSLGRLLLLGSIGSRHMGFHSCSTWVQQLHCADLSAWALVVPGHRLSSCSSQALERGCRSCGTRGYSCPIACGIFLDRGLNPCPLYLQADSHPLHRQGSPHHFLNHNLAIMEFRSTIFP